MKSDKKDEDTVFETKKKGKALLEEQGLPVLPGLNVSDEKPTKQEGLMLHVATEHLFLGVLGQLDIARAELKKVKDDERATKMKDRVKELMSATEALINDMSDEVPAMPNIEGYHELMQHLVDEIEAVQVMKMADVPAEKMH